MNSSTDWCLKGNLFINPSNILILCFNYNAAISLKKRLSDLNGKDAKRVTVLTYHSSVMKLAGRSFAVDSKWNSFYRVKCL